MPLSDERATRWRRQRILTQEFFARWFDRHDFDAARREKGRLRSFLLVSLKHFLTNE